MRARSRLSSSSRRTKCHSQDNLGIWAYGSSFLHRAADSFASGSILKVLLSVCLFLGPAPASVMLGSILYMLSPKFSLWPTLSSIGASQLCLGVGLGNMAGNTIAQLL